MVFTRRRYKFLRYLNRHSGCEYSAACKKFGKDFVDGFFYEYIYSDEKRKRDSEGYPIGDHSPHSHLFLTELGLSLAESSAWFTLEFVVRNILLPIGISVITAIIIGIMRI